MKENRFLIAALISNLLLLPYNYSAADYYSQKHEDLIREASNSNAQEVQRIIQEIPKYEGENNKSSFISISSTDEEILRSLTQTSSYPLPQLCTDCHLPDKSYPVVGYNSARNNETALGFRNKIRYDRITNKLWNRYELAGREPYYCGTVKLPLDEIYRRLNENDYVLTANIAYEDSGEIAGAKRYYNFKRESLLQVLGITPTLCAANPLLALATIYLAFPERQKHIRIFPTEEEGVYEIRAHDEPSIFHPLQHLHWTSSTVSDNYDEVKQIFPEIEGEPERGTWTSEGKINKGLREIGIKIRSFLRI
ncbi:MAG: hypothetical protein J7J51_02545 [Candidatus Omnitrophica bacterium]|nr:hypothetical protein [Candidatus Omnitrophota bacterium]